MRKRALGHSTCSKANSPAKSCPCLGPTGYLDSILAQPTLKFIQHLHRKLVRDVTSIGDDVGFTMTCCTLTKWGNKRPCKIRPKGFLHQGPGLTTSGNDHNCFLALASSFCTYASSAVLSASDQTLTGDARM